MRLTAVVATLSLGGSLALWTAPASAQLFHLYLDCKGDVVSHDSRAKRRPLAGHLRLALRDNNQLALIQDSNVLPIGEAMHYVPTQQAYTMVYRAPLRGSAVFRTWSGWPIFVWYPALDRLDTIRLAIDRQSGELSGDLLNAGDESLASLEMTCVPSSDADQPAPRF